MSLFQSYFRSIIIRSELKIQYSLKCFRKRIVITMTWLVLHEALYVFEFIINLGSVQMTLNFKDIYVRVKFNTGKTYPATSFRNGSTWTDFDTPVLDMMLGFGSELTQDDVFLGGWDGCSCSLPLLRGTMRGTMGSKRSGAVAEGWHAYASVPKSAKPNCNCKGATHGEAAKLPHPQYPLWLQLPRHVGPATSCTEALPWWARHHQILRCPYWELRGHGR